MLRDPRLISVLLIASAAPMGAAVVSPALPAMANSLGVSDARIGLVMTALTLPPMVLSPVIGIASDLYGRRTIALPAAFLFGISGVAIAFVSDFTTILLLRGLQGVAIAGLAPVAITLLGDLYSGETGTTAQGIRTSTAGIALSLVPLIAGWLAGFSWRTPFLLFGIAFLIVGVGFKYIPETSTKVGEGNRLRESLSEYRRSVRDEFTDVSLLVVIIGGFVRFFSLFAFLTFIPIFAVRSLGATSFEVGIIIGLTGVRIAVSPTAGRWVARFSRRLTLVGALGMLAASFALLPFATNVLTLGALAVVHSMGDAILSPVVNDAATAAVRAENRNGVVSAMRVLKEAGKTVAPIVLGVLLAIGGFEIVFVATAGLLVGYAIAVLGLVRPITTGRPTTA